MIRPRIPAATAQPRQQQQNAPPAAAQHQAALVQPSPPPRQPQLPAQHPVPQAQPPPPAQPPAPPAQPPAPPAQPAVVPVQPPVVPAQPAGVPAQPPAPPAQPPAPPAQPSAPPLQPAVVPVQPAGVPVQPPVVPAQPAGVPAQPPAPPAQPPAPPAQPAVVPVLPAGVPVQPPVVPAQPAGVPAQPPAPPVQPPSSTGPQGLQELSVPKRSVIDAVRCGRTLQLPRVAARNKQLFVVAEDKIHHLLATLNADFTSTTQFAAIPLFGFPEGERDASPEPTRVEHFVMDFEDGMWGAIRSVFPNCTREGCAFHLTLAIDNQCITRRGVYELMRKLMVLQFLPAQRIDRALADLRQHTTHPTILELMDYMEREVYDFWRDVKEWHQQITNKTLCIDVVNDLLSEQLGTEDRLTTVYHAQPPVDEHFRADNCNAIGKLTRKGTSKPERPQPRQPAPTRPRRGEPQAGSADHYCLVSMRINYYSAGDLENNQPRRGTRTRRPPRRFQDEDINAAPSPLPPEPPWTEAVTGISQGQLGEQQQEHLGHLDKKTLQDTAWGKTVWGDWAISKSRRAMAALNPKCFALVRDVAEKYQRGGGGHINGQGKKREVRQALFEHLKGRAAEDQEMWL
ncbi:hypothetical protein Bbelb_282740 [Branchiostoma belcheri]|nr:hypothetical protein Bbelb_282740 [Branchiostoma belcheri]